MSGHVFGLPFFALKIVPLRVGPTRVHIPNGILIGSAVSAGFTVVTDRQTDRPRVTLLRL